MLNIIATTAKFPLGQIVATPNALKTLTPQEIAVGLERHANGDWGNVCNEDAELNIESLTVVTVCCQPTAEARSGSGSSLRQTAR